MTLTFVLPELASCDPCGKPLDNTTSEAKTTFRKKARSENVSKETKPQNGARL